MFITFEGIEGSGKSTLITRLDTYFTDKGAAVVRTREPGGSRLGRELRAILLDPANTDIRPEAELFLYLADRAQHVGSLIRPALEDGKTVLCDRYADSTVVYQGYGRGLDPDHLFALNDAAVSGLWPDLTFLLDLEPEVGLARARGRNAESDLEDSEGRFEAESLAFHTRIREGYLAMAERYPGRYRVLDGSLSPDEVFKAARRVLEAGA